MKRQKKQKPARLRSRYARGYEKCATVKGRDGSPLQLCVRGAKHGFSAWLKAKSGKGQLPVSGVDRSTRNPDAALRQAKAWLKRHGNIR